MASGCGIVILPQSRQILSTFLHTIAVAHPFLSPWTPRVVGTDDRRRVDPRPLLLPSAPSHVEPDLPFRDARLSLSSSMILPRPAAPVIGATAAAVPEPGWRADPCWASA